MEKEDVFSAPSPTGNGRGNGKRRCPFCSPLPLAGEGLGERARKFIEVIMTTETIDLPINIDPVRLAKRKAKLAGSIDVIKFIRLTPLLANTNSNCFVDLAFALDEKNRCFIEGRVQGRLELFCQRCLGPFEWAFNLPIKLAVLKSETDEAKLPADFEAILLQEEGVNLCDVIEDELLLSVPNYPLHEEL